MVTIAAEDVVASRVIVHIDIFFEKLHHVLVGPERRSEPDDLFGNAEGHVLILRFEDHAAEPEFLRGGLLGGAVGLCEL